MVRASAAAFICATISTSPVAASVATQVTRPFASNLGESLRLSSTSAAGPGGANGAEFSDKEASNLASLPAHQREEAHLLVCVVAEQAGELGRHRGDPRLLHAAHRHAHGLGFQHDGDAAGFENLVDGGADLCRQALV